MVIPLSGNTAIQKETAPHLPFQNPKEPVIIDNKTERKSNIFWEKGAFIDIYIWWIRKKSPFAQLLQEFEVN